MNSSFLLPFIFLLLKKRYYIRILWYELFSVHWFVQYTPKSHHRPWSRCYRLFDVYFNVAIDWHPHNYGKGACRSTKYKVSPDFAARYREITCHAFTRSFLTPSRITPFEIHTIHMCLDLDELKAITRVTFSNFMSYCDKSLTCLWVSKYWN